MENSPRLQKLERLLAAEPNDPFCLYAMGQEFASLGQPESAIAWFDRAIAADPDHAYARFHKARALESLGRLAEAKASLREGLAAAERTRDGKARSELASALDSLEP